MRRRKVKEKMRTEKNRDSPSASPCGHAVKSNESANLDCNVLDDNDDIINSPNIDHLDQSTTVQKKERGTYR